MRGTTEECLEDFFRRAPAEALGHLCEFAGYPEPMSMGTIRRWKRGVGLPKGDSAWRLRVFLQLVGYEVAELQSLSQSVLRVGLLIAYRAAQYEDAEEVRQRLHYSDLKGLYRLLLQGGTPAKRHAYRLQMQARDTDELLEEAKRPWLEKLGPTIDHLRTSAPVEEAEAVEADTEEDFADMAEPEPDASSSNVIVHLVLALDSLIGGMTEPEREQAVAALEQQVSRDHLRTVRAFLGLAFE